MTDELIEAFKCPRKECGKTAVLAQAGVEDTGLGYTGIHEVDCEDCGSHPAAKCPHCDEFIDLVMQDPFVTIRVSELNAVEG